MYPVNLILTDKPCLVLGGGHVAARKVHNLLEAQAKVTIISPDLLPELEALVQTQQITWQQRCYKPGDLNSYHLVICAIGNDAVSAQVYNEAESKHILLNVVDNLPYCNFTLPARIRQGDLLVTFSTGGKSPALSRYLRQSMEQFFDESYALWLERLVLLRKEAISQLPTADDREEFWRWALSDKVMGLVKQKQFDQAEAEIRHAISCFRSKS